LDGFEREIVALLPRLRRFGRVLAHDPADADDLVQLAVERGLTRRGQFQPGTRLDSWMFGIMRNAWIDETRFRRRRSAILAPAEDGERVGHPGGVEAAMAARDVQQAMAALPDDQRIAIGLVLIEGLSYKDAAEVLKLPMGTVASRIVRGRMALMAQLQEFAP
jgi:RNA polymerase sigma-70 factor (ECF subfamily)